MRTMVMGGMGMGTDRTKIAKPGHDGGCGRQERTP